MKFKFTYWPPGRWEELRQPLREHFDDALPVTPEQATFPCLVDERGRLAAVFHVEHLFHFNSLLVMPQYRNQGLALRLAREAVARMPPGHSGIWLLSETQGEHGKLFARRMGFRELGKFTAFRRDV